MAQKVNWPGKSGRKYQFSVFDMVWEPAPNQDGNYIFAKIVNGAWTAVYIGQGDLKDRRSHHLRESCVTKHGATHYLCHLNPNREARLSEESDLLANHLEAYNPSGCNVKVGG